MSYVAVRKVFRCVFCGVETTENIELHWSIWDQLVHDTPEMAITGELGEKTWRLGSVCVTLATHGASLIKRTKLLKASSTNLTILSDLRRNDHVVYQEPL
jgi:hypothetical protein